MSNSPLVDYTKISPRRNSPRNHKIDTITIHHMAGNLSVETCGQVFQTRQASSNYGVDSKGRVGLYVDEGDRSWASANPTNDHRAVTIEVANCGGAPDWPVNDAAYEKLIELVEDICRRNGIEKLVWGANKADRVNHRNGCNMTVHQDFMATSCPGPYLLRRMPQIAADVNAKLGTAADKPPAEKPATVQVGDVVEFTGNCHYPSANIGISFPCKPGNARVTRILTGAKHPYHIIHTGAGCTVYGWVDEKDIRT